MARKKDPAIPLYASDFLSDPDVSALPLADQGLLVRIWCMLWMQGPMERERILNASYILCSNRDDIARVIDEFLIDGGDGRLLSKRMEEERAERVEIREQRAKAGKRSGTSRRKNAG